MSADARFGTFLLDDLLFGVPASQIQEVILNDEITRVPLAPRSVRGLINLRGQIVPVVDLRSVLGLEDPRTPAAVPTHVVVRTADGPVSLLVDEIQDVVEVSAGGLERPPETIPAGVRRLVQGIHELEGRLLLVLDAHDAVTTPFRESDRSV